MSTTALLRVSALRQSVSSSRQSALRGQPLVHRRFLAKKAKEDKAKKAAKPAKPAATGQRDSISTEVNPADQTYKKVVAALDAPYTKPPPASPEEMERRAKVGREYGLQMFKRHNQEEHVLACRIRLKNHAIDMLPKNSKIRTAALETDDEGPPRWRLIPVWTPPIEGFNPDDYLDAEDQK